MHANMLCVGGPAGGCIGMQAIRLWVGSAMGWGRQPGGIVVGHSIWVNAGGGAPSGWGVAAAGAVVSGAAASLCASSRAGAATPYPIRAEAFSQRFDPPSGLSPIDALWTTSSSATSYQWFRLASGWMRSLPAWSPRPT
jgi:hypothetical protein